MGEAIDVEKLIETLREDRDVRHEGGCQNCDWRLKTEAADALSSLLQRLRELEGGLRPFARAGEIWATSREPADAQIFCDLWQPHMRSDGAASVSDPEFTVADFLLARSLLEGGVTRSSAQSLPCGMGSQASLDAGRNDADTAAGEP